MQGFTLLLDKEWDLTLDRAGNVAVTAGAYAIAQNAANEVRLFIGDAYFDQGKGIPHFNIELGQSPHIISAILSTRLKKAALSVAGVVAATVKLETIVDEMRTQRGEVQLTLEDGTSANIEIGGGDDNI